MHGTLRPTNSRRSRGAHDACFLRSRAVTHADGVRGRTVEGISAASTRPLEPTATGGVDHRAAEVEITVWRNGALVDVIAEPRQLSPR